MGQNPFDPRRFRLLGPLTEPQALTIRLAVERWSIPRRRRIYERGDRSDHLFFLQAGVVRIATPLPRGNRENVLMLVFPGDVFGELAIIEEGPRNHFAEAHEDSLVWAVHRRVLSGVIDQSPALGFELARLMARRARSLSSRIEEPLWKDARERVASTLWHLAVEHAVSDADGLLIPARLTQSDLANMTGLARETVNGVLRDLRANGIAEVTRHNIRIKCPNALHSAGAMTDARPHHQVTHARTRGSQRGFAPAANARRMAGDAGDAFDDGAGRPAVGAGSPHL